MAGIRSGPPRVCGCMATPELISLIVALVAWILLLRSFAVDG